MALFKGMGEVKVFPGWNLMFSYKAAVATFIEEKYRKSTGMDEDDDYFYGPEYYSMLVTYREHKKILKEQKQWQKFVGHYEHGLRINRNKI